MPSAEHYSVYSVIFSGNNVYHADGNYFSLRTPASRIIDYDRDHNIVYIELEPAVCKFIESIDLKYMTKFATDMLEFLHFSSTFLSSIKRGANGARNVLPIRLRSYTRINTILETDAMCMITLMVNYRRDALIWSAVQIDDIDYTESAVQQVNDDADAEVDEAIFQNCLLVNDVIKI